MGEAVTRPVRRAGTRATPRSADVARLAGVSQKTVSRVFNDEPYVSDDGARTRARRGGGARLPDERRGPDARLRADPLDRRGDARDRAVRPRLAAHRVERAARDAGYALRVVSTMEGDPAGVADAVDSLLEQGVDGIVISEPIDEGAGADPGRRADHRARRAVPARAPPSGERRGRRAAPWPRRPPSTCWTSGIGPFITSPARSAGTPPRTGSRAGGQRWRRTAGPNRPSSRATGPRRPATPPAVSWPPTST